MIIIFFICAYMEKIKWDVILRDLAIEGTLCFQGPTVAQ